MRSLLVVVVPGLAAFAALTLAPSRAEACSAPYCWPGSFSPRDGGSVPANVPAFHWNPLGTFGDQESADPTKVKLATAAAPDVALPLTATKLDSGEYLLAPQQPLQPGTQYVLVDGNTCGDAPYAVAGPSIKFTATAVAPLPTQLGGATLGAATRGNLEVATGSGSCSVEVDAQQAEIELAFDPSASPWRDVMHYETLVDGMRWYASSSINIAVPTGESWRGRGADRVYRVCEQPEWGGPVQGLAEGPHDIVFRATVPGTSTVLTSGSLALALECDDDDGGDDDGHDHDDDDHDHGGCSAGADAASPLLLLALLAARRRRGRAITRS